MVGEARARSWRQPHRHLRRASEYTVCNVHPLTEALNDPGKPQIDRLTICSLFSAGGVPRAIFFAASSDLVATTSL